MYALRKILIPGTLAAGYQRGHEVPDSVIADWGLIEGEDYAAELVDDSAPAVAPRPVDDSDRAAWVSYVTSRGTDPDDAAQMQVSDLMKLYPENEHDSAPDGEPTPYRPADSARKAEWVEYVVAGGADPEWANASDTTKADLQEWQPGAAPREQRTTDPAADQGNATAGA